MKSSMASKKMQFSEIRKIIQDMKEKSAKRYRFKKKKSQ
jgi:hypothetical protein